MKEFGEVDSCPVSGYGVAFLRRTMALLKATMEMRWCSRPFLLDRNDRGWIPAYAGMTVGGSLESLMSIAVDTTNHQRMMDSLPSLG